MGYVIAGILVVLIVAAAIAFFVTSATKRKGQASIAAPDSTPLGDTEEHAGEHNREGETVADPEAGRGMDPSDPAPAWAVRARAAPAARVRAAVRSRPSPSVWPIGSASAPTFSGRSDRFG